MFSKYGDKQIFQLVFLMLFLLLLTLPIILTFNELITKFIENNGFYMAIQKYVVPSEAKFMGVILQSFGYNFIANPTGLTVNGLYMKFTWNCIGWQSFILFFVTLIFGFSKGYRFSSKVEVLLIGVLGTFWINILRMIFTVMLAIHLQPVFRIVFHDYLAAIVTVLWLFFFWYFAYSYILESKEV